MRHLLIAELIFNHSQLVAGIDTKLNAVVLISVKVKNEYQSNTIEITRAALIPQTTAKIKIGSTLFFFSIVM